jgi:hypothetical protein
MGGMIRPAQFERDAVCCRTNVELSGLNARRATLGFRTATGNIKMLDSLFSMLKRAVIIFANIGAFAVS